jgi:hypothetical protein
MRTGHQNNHKYQICKAPFTRPTVGNSDGTKGTGCAPYSLIAVHEEAGDECAHAQLIADILYLHYRGTSLSTSNEKTRALPKTESCVAAWLEFFFWSTLSFFSTSGTKTEGSLLGEEQNRRERWPSGNVAKASRQKNKKGDDIELRRFWVKGFPFMAAAGLQRSFNQPGICCRQHGARQWSAREVLAS